MDNFGSMLAILVLACGVYCIYACITMKKTGEINKTILSSKGMEGQQCKDTKAYIQEAIPKVLVLGISAIIYGGLDLINYYLISLGMLSWIMMVVFFGVLVWVAYGLKKLHKKYY
ncbi:MAG: hypothetical protein ACRC3H_26520 [Lachnospiraceae bacterium]